MTDQIHDEIVDEAPQFTDVTGDDHQATSESAKLQSYRLTRDAQLEALRADVMRLRAELAAIAAGSSRLAALETNVAIETVENKIRRHVIPTVVVAGIVGYLWTAFVRPR
ncbi:hypothetical protein [Ensifer sp.]|jgi:hypothetical protein|uniref:hypothetical protein n=1 Tax=Ensifer sp. TaxID=1872086 RepID=UPI002E137340|nr:hypothetical protein [Ensifer sp.]